MNLVLKPLQFIYSLYVVVVFIAVMLIAFPFVIIALFFGRLRGGNFIYAICRYWSAAWYALCGFRHQTIYESPHSENRQYIFVANHSSYMDVPPLLLGIKQPVRVLGKSEMGKVPVFGLIYRNAAVLVDRSDAEKRARSVAELKDFLQHQVSIFIFPEGTFNETAQPLGDFFDGAFRIALETSTPLKPILMVDAVDRMHYKTIFSFTPGKNRLVYLQEVPVAGLTMADLPFLKQTVYKAMDEGLRRYRNYPALM